MKNAEIENKEEKTEANGEEYNNKGYFSITLLIRHPNIDPDIITKELELEPYRCWKAGEKRFTPKGTLLEGRWQITSWNHVYRFKYKKLKGSFSKEIEKIINQLYVNKDFFNKIFLENGSTTLDLNLPGWENQGDVISIDTLQKLVDAKIELSIEVLPNWELNPDRD